jgi:hypothetical protein
MTEKSVFGLFTNASTLGHSYFEFVSDFEFCASNLSPATGRVERFHCKSESWKIPMLLPAKRLSSLQGRPGPLWPLEAGSSWQ